VIEHKPCGVDRVADSLDTRHASRPQILSIHQQSVQLHTAILREERATPRVEDLVIFHDSDGSLYGVHSSRSFFEKSVARSQRLLYTVFVGCDGVVGHRPGSAVNDKYRFTH
jgi:hypothetical protein